MAIEFDPPPRPDELWRLSAAASMCGLSICALDAHIREGGIPGCGIVEIGPRRIKHLRRPDVFIKWLRHEHLPIENDCDDLFAPEPQKAAPLVPHHSAR